MDKIAAIVTKLQELVANQEEIILSIVKKNESALLDLNTSQLYEGLKADGTKITPEYSDLTIARKQILNQPTNRVTLFDEGDFYRGFFAETQKFPIIISSSDIKTEKLDAKYGPNLFGLTGENKKEFAEIIKEEVKQAYTKALDV